MFHTPIRIDVRPRTAALVAAVFGVTVALCAAIGVALLAAAFAAFVRPHWSVGSRGDPIPADTDPDTAMAEPTSDSDGDILGPSPPKRRHRNPSVF